VTVQTDSFRSSKINIPKIKYELHPVSGRPTAELQRSDRIEFYQRPDEIEQLSRCICCALAPRRNVLQTMATNLRR